jgi:hypothetical protein
MARFQFRDCTKLTSSGDYSWVDCGLFGAALASNDANDSTYNSIEGQIQSLTTQRDALVGQMIGLLNGAEFKGQSFRDAQAQSVIAQGQALLNQGNGLPH